MIDIADNAILLASGEHSRPPTSLEEAREMLRLDDEIIQIIRDNVRAADPVTRRWLTVMIARYQVYFSRINDWWNATPPMTNPIGQTQFNPNREDALLDWATFHALVGHHYEYARSAIDQVPTRMDPSRIRSAFFHNIFHIDFTTGFEKRIEYRLARIKDGRVEHFEFKLNL
ncbi:hypothetical protein ACFMBG_07015 [Leisingera sp. D0M16]|uniref:hypothetical protein n=1 Tax=Leisingera coralii TaxID=3351347 RepID=UPI003B7BBD61